MRYWQSSLGCDWHGAWSDIAIYHLLVSNNFQTYGNITPPHHSPQRGDQHRVCGYNLSKKITSNE